MWRGLAGSRQAGSDTNLTRVASKVRSPKSDWCGQVGLSAREVAEWLGVPVGKIYAQRYRSTGPASYKVGRHIRFRRDDVESWLEEQRCEPVPPSILGQLLGASPVRQVARTLVPSRTGRRTTIALPGSLSRMGFAAPGAQGANPRPHPRIVRARGRVLEAAGEGQGGEEMMVSVGLLG